MEDTDILRITFAGSITLFSVLLAVIYVKLQANSGRKSPPGPRGLPILGNALQIPKQHIGGYFRELIQTYGGLVSLNLAGTPAILIGEMKLAKHVLEKRAAKFSGRPSMYYFNNYVDPSEKYWAFRDQSEGWNIARKLTTGIMSSVRAGMTEPLQQFESLLSLQHLLDDNGKDWGNHLYRMATSATSQPHLVCIVLPAMIPSSRKQYPIVNFLPFLDWLPGPMPWRIRAKAYQKREDSFFTEVIREAVSGKAAGMNTWAAEFAREDKPEGDQSRFMNQFAGAAIETISVALQVFILACIMYPQWISDAQKQIDDIVGPDRLPTFTDRPNLPYVVAVVRETLRWRPPARFGIAHRSTADDIVEYNGEQYFIPAGATIFYVTWAIEHDPNNYLDPGRFDPERFLDDNGQLRSDYETSAFGFGRRVCPGIPFAERTLWIAIATLLWTFNIRKSEETSPETGLPFQYDDSDAAFHDVLTTSPRRFPAVFEARSSRHSDVVRREWEQCEKNLNVILPVRK